jgi:hypothetical protein
MTALRHRIKGTSGSVACHWLSGPDGRADSPEEVGAGGEW